MVRFRRFGNPPQADQIPPLKNNGVKRRANVVIMGRTNGTLNDYEMQHNKEVGLFTKPSWYFIVSLYQHFPGFGTVRGPDDPLSFHGFDNTRGTVVSDTQMAL